MHLEIKKKQVKADRLALVAQPHRRALRAQAFHADVLCVAVCGELIAAGSADGQARRSRVVSARTVVLRALVPPCASGAELWRAPSDARPSLRG